MRRIFAVITGVAGILAASTGLGAAAQGTPASTTAADKLAEIETLAPMLLARHDVPSVGVAYIEDGEIAFVRHYGFQSWGYPANEETLYNVASLTKPVTAEIVLRAIDQGRFSLDTKLADHHMEDDVASDPRTALLTPRLVLRHRTGFPNWRYQTEGTLRFLRDPDTEDGYSGEGFEWMMKSVVAATGEDFEALADELLFDPAEMPLTSYTRAQQFFGRVAVPYKAGEAPFNVIRDEPSASDDMRTTTREYARFLIDVWEGDAVSPELRREQRTIRHTTIGASACRGEDRADFCPVNQGWGLGWFLYDYGDRQLVQHSGGDFGEATFALYDPEARRGVVVLTNGASGGKVMQEIAGVLDGDPRLAEFLKAPYD